MTSLRKLFHSASAPLCWGLIIGLASCMLWEGPIETDHDLFHSLNDPDLTAESVDGVLEIIVDKENTKIGPFTVSKILYVKDYSVENCLPRIQHEYLDMQRTFKEGSDGSDSRFKWDESLNYGYNYGLARFYDKYLPKLIEYCDEHADEVFEKAVNDVKDGDQEGERRLEALEKEFPADLQSMTYVQIMECRGNYLQSNPETSEWGIEERCSKVEIGLDFAQEFRGPASRKLSDDPKSLYQKWARIKQVCAILLIARIDGRAPADGTKSSHSTSSPYLAHMLLGESKLRRVTLADSACLELGNRLNDTSLSLEQVEAMVEAVEEEQKSCFGNLTPELILGLKILSIENCAGTRLGLFEESFRLVPPIFGLNLFYQHYWPELIQYCSDSIEKVAHFQEVLIGPEHLHRVGNFVSTIKADRITVRDVYKAWSRKLNNRLHQDARERVEAFDESCRTYLQGFKYLKLLPENNDSNLVEFYRSKLGYILRATKVCHIYLDVHNNMSIHSHVKSTYEQARRK